MTINKPNTQSGDILLEVALGTVAGYKALNKFGHALDADNGIPTDIWDGADGTISTDLWVAPTAARIHALVSSDADDTAAGTGMRTVKVYGLAAWSDTVETIETVTLNGTGAVNTVSPYVIIYRMIGQTFGASGANEGVVKATAATDNTITAAIAVGNSQTQMAIFGVPTSSRLVILHMHMDILGRSAVTAATGSLIVELDPGSGTSGIRVVREWNVQPVARYDAEIRPPLCIPGPALVKMQVLSDADGASVTGTFDGIVAESANIDAGNTS